MVLQTSYMMDILLMEAGGAWVLSWMLGWAVTDPRRFPGPAYGFWVPPPPPLVFWGRAHLTHICHHGLHSHGSPHPALLTVTCKYPVPGSGPSFPVDGSSRGAPPLHLASVILGTASHLHHCGPGHHPSIICLTSIILASGSSGLQGLVHGRLSFIRLHIR